MRERGYIQNSPGYKDKGQAPRPHSQKNKVELRSTLELKNTSLGIRRTDTVLSVNLDASANLNCRLKERLKRY